MPMPQEWVRSLTRQSIRDAFGNEDFVLSALRVGLSLSAQRANLLSLLCTLHFELCALKNGAPPEIIGCFPLAPEFIPGYERTIDLLTVLTVFATKTAEAVRNGEHLYPRDKSRG